MTAGSARLAYPIFWGYCALIAALLAVGVLAPIPAAGMAWIVVWALGLAALVVGILWLRPERPAAWWLIAVSLLFGLGAGIVASFAVLGSGAGTPPPGLLEVSGVLRFFSYLALVVGVALLSRSAEGRSRLGDVLDAALVACGVFVLLWVLVISPARNPRPGQAATVTELVLYPVGVLLVFALAAKLLFTVGARTASLRLLMLGILFLVAGTLAVVVQTLTVGGFGFSRAIPLAFAAFHGVVGAAGLHPSMSRRGLAPSEPNPDLSWPRIALFAVLAVLGPAAWAVEVELSQPNQDIVELIVPIVISSLLSLLLVARLTMIARIAQARSQELERRSAELAEAMREQDDLRRQLTYRALHDPLTGLANRVVLNERMEWALTKQDHGGRQALLLLDLDDFKEVNDNLGHVVGDDVLVSVARRLQEVTPGDATLARLGGDEFAMLLDGTSRAPAQSAAERIRAAIGEPYEVGGRKVFTTGSIGLFIADPDDPAVTPSTALRDADLALYAAKSQGKNRVVTYHSELRTEQLSHARMSTGLRRALARDEFTLNYQPMIDLATEQITGVEALLRWTLPGGESVPPTEFIPVAEEIGLIGAIGDWVLRRACGQARPWYEHHGIILSVNVSGRQLDDPHFADRVIEVLHTVGLPGRALVLELTETSLVTVSAATLAVTQLGRIREQGVRVAVDDFGTGYSSLSYLSRLPVDIIKLDRSFVTRGDEPDSGRTSRSFINAILTLVRSRGLQTIAEGVETAEQAAMLRQLRCPLGQGFYFSRPVPPMMIDKALAERGGQAA